MKEMPGLTGHDGMKGPDMTGGRAGHDGMKGPGMTGGRAGLSFRDIHGLFALTFQMFGEVVDKTPIEIFIHVTEAVSLLRQHEHIKSLTRSDKGVNNPDSVAGMNIIIDVAMYKQKMSLQILRNLRICSDLVDEGSVTLVAHRFLDSMMGLAPPAVVYVVVMIACA